MADKSNNISDYDIFVSSDHIPIISEFYFDNDKDNNKKVLIGSFNILATKYLLKHQESMIKNQKLAHLVELALDNIRNGERTRLILNIEQIFLMFSMGVTAVGIQEGFKEFIDEFKSDNIFDKYGIIKSYEKEGSPLVIYDKNKLEFIENQYSKVSYPDNKYAIMNILFKHKKTGRGFRFINTHAPFGKIDFLVDYINDMELVNNVPSVLVGDFNTTGYDFVKILDERGCNKKIEGSSLEPNPLVYTYDFTVDNGDEKLMAINFTHKNLLEERVIFDHILNISKL